AGRPRAGRGQAHSGLGGARSRRRPPDASPLRRSASVPGPAPGRAPPEPRPPNALPVRGNVTSQGYTRAVTEPLWRPTPARAAASSMDAFRRAAAEQHGLELHDYDALHAWSV